MSKTCYGCLNNISNQQGHMDINGCLYEKDEKTFYLFTNFTMSILYNSEMEEMDRTLHSTIEGFQMCCKNNIFSIETKLIVLLTPKILLNRFPDLHKYVHPVTVDNWTGVEPGSYDASCIQISSSEMLNILNSV